MCTTDPISRKHRTRWAGTGTAPSVTGQTATTPAGANGEEDDLVPAIGTTPTKPTEPGETTAPSETGGETTGTKPVKTMWPVEGETGGCLRGGQAGLQ